MLGRALKTALHLPEAGKNSGVRISPLALVYIVIGVIVAAFRDYLENLDRLKPIISAILAVLLWPLVLIGVDVRVD
jgi:hypothetical protein